MEDVGKKSNLSGSDRKENKKIGKYYSAKEIKSQSKISWHIYAFDFLFAYLWSGCIHDAWQS